MSGPIPSRIEITIHGEGRWLPSPRAEFLGGPWLESSAPDQDVDELPTRVRARQVLLEDHDFAWVKAHPREPDAEAARWELLVALRSRHEVGLCMWDYYSFLVLLR